MAVLGNRNQILVKSVGTFADSISRLILFPLSLLWYPQASLLKRWMFHCSPVTVPQSHSCHQSVEQLHLSQIAYSTLQVTKIGLKEPVKCRTSSSFILPEEVLHSWLLFTADYNFPPSLSFSWGLKGAVVATAVTSFCSMKWLLLNKRQTPWIYSSCQNLSFSLDKFLVNNLI